MFQKQLVSIHCVICTLQGFTHDFLLVGRETQPKISKSVLHIIIKTLPAIDAAYVDGSASIIQYVGILPCIR